jgi:hypothetical protein
VGGRLERFGGDRLVHDRLDPAVHPGRHRRVLGTRRGGLDGAERVGERLPAGVVAGMVEAAVDDR